MQSLCDEARDLGTTLEHLAEIVQRGVEQYPPGSLERDRLDKDLARSPMLLERVNALSRYAHIVSNDQGKCLIPGQRITCSLRARGEAQDEIILETFLVEQQRRRDIGRDEGQDFDGPPSLPGNSSAP